jgi:hypothetical protein
MRTHGQNHRPDANAKTIVKDLRKVGAKVFPIGRPCDLLVRFAFRLYLIDVSNPDYPNRKRDPDQITMFKEWGVIEVSTSDEALRAIGAM